MGYDFHHLTPHPDYPANKAAYLARITELNRTVKDLRDQGGDGAWLTESEEQTLSEDERAVLRSKRIRDWSMTFVPAEGNNFYLATLRARTVPASEAYLTAVAERDHFLLDETVKHDEYFRLNGGGMRFYAGLMDQLGMLKNTVPDSDWPQRPPLDADTERNILLLEMLDEALWAAPRRLALTDPRVAIEAGMATEWFTSHYGPNGEEPSPALSAQEIDAYVAYQQARIEHQAAHDPAVPGVEGRKYGSNDGWWVTKEECASVVAIWERAQSHLEDLDPELRVGLDQAGSYWLAWMQYHQDGAAGDGYVVN